MHMKVRANECVRDIGYDQSGKILIFKKYIENNKLNQIGNWINNPPRPASAVHPSLSGFA